MIIFFLKKVKKQKSKKVKKQNIAHFALKKKTCFKIFFEET